MKGTGERDIGNVETFERIVKDFFDFALCHVPSYKKYFNLRTTTLRKERANNRNLFFRPIGLEILARLYVIYARSDSLERLKLGFSRVNFQNPGGVFDGILWTNGKISAGSEEKKAAVELCRYVLGDLTAVEKQQLLRSLRYITKNQRYRLPARL